MILMPNSFSFIDPFLSSGLAANVLAIRAIVDFAVPRIKQDRLTRNDLFPLEERLIKETEYLDRYLHSLFISFGNHELFSTTLLIFQLGIFLELAGLNDERLGEQACLWRTDLPVIQKMIDNFHEYLSGIEDHENFDKLSADPLLEIFRSCDEYNFLESKIFKDRMAGKQTVSVWALLHWVLSARGKERKKISTRIRDLLVLGARHLKLNTRKQVKPWSGIRMRGLKNLFGR